MEVEPLGGFREEFADWSAERMLAAADEALVRLKTFGVQVVPNNRLSRAKALIERCERFNVQLGRGDPQMEHLLSEAYKTVFEIQFIVRGANKPNLAEVKRLGLMLRGDDLPQDQLDDPARDTQAEFLTAALFWTAGYTVRMDEPDLVISKGSRKLGVAVKRVKSKRQFKKHIRKASLQLSAQRLDGFIVINPEVLLSRAYYSDRSTDVSRFLFERTMEWIKHIDYQHPLSPVLAVVGVATSFRWRPGGSGRQFDVLLHFHPRFVTDESRAGLESVQATATELFEAMIASLRVLHQQ